jgi:hypothetical protein
MTSITTKSKKFADYIITKEDVESCQKKMALEAAYGNYDATYICAVYDEDAWFEHAFAEIAEAAGDFETLEAYSQWCSAEYDMWRYA